MKQGSEPGGDGGGGAANATEVGTCLACSGNSGEAKVAGALSEGAISGARDIGHLGDSDFFF